MSNSEPNLGEFIFVIVINAIILYGLFFIL